MGTKFQNKFFRGTRKNELSEGNEITKKIIFFFIFSFFTFFLILQIWSDMKVHSRNSLNMKVHFFPFWHFDQQDGSLCSILFSDFFWQFWKIRKRFFKLFFLFLDF